MPQPWPPPSIMVLGLALPALTGPGQDGFQFECSRRHQADADEQEKEDHAWDPHNLEQVINDAAVGEGGKIDWPLEFLRGH
jgi:hypothetical protein